MKLSDIIDKMPASPTMGALEELAKTDPVLWCAINRRVKGAPLIFDNSRKLSEESLGEVKRTLIQSDYEKELYNRLLHHRPFLKQPLRDQHPHKVYEKGRQVGASELAVCEMFHFLATNPGTKIIATFPRDRQLTDFSVTRVASVFAESPRMAALAGVPNQVLTKRIGDSYLLFRSAWESNLGEGVDADAVFLDEKDRMRDKVELAFRESLKSSRHGLFREYSTPTLPGRGIDVPYRDSDQHTWMVKCERCGERQPIDWKENIVQIKDVPLGTKELPPESYEYACHKQKCRGKLDRVFSGQWAAAHPERRLIRGYHISQLIAPWVSATRVMQDKIDFRWLQPWLNYVCFFDADTNITTRRGAKRIASIEAGDRVLSHDGEFHTVTETKNSIYTGTRVDILVGRNEKPNLSVTTEHPLYVVKQAEMLLEGCASPRWVQAGEIESGDWLVYPRIASRNVEMTIDFSDYVDQDTVTVTNDEVLQFDNLTKQVRDNALHTPRYWNIDDRASKFLGLFLAEGCVTTPTTVHHKKEEDLIELSRSTFTQLGANVQLIDPSKYPSQKSRNALVVAAPSVTLRQAFTKLFGGVNRNKRVPRFVLDLPRSCRLAFLAGYFGGDGCIHEQNLSVRTCSPHIAHSVQMIMSSIGVPTIVKPVHTQLRGKPFLHHMICVTGSWREFLLNELRPHLSTKMLGKVEVNMQTSSSIHSDAKHFYFRVGEVKKSRVRAQQVYNFEVNKTHSYIANGFVSHNCGLPSSMDDTLISDLDFEHACAGHDVVPCRTKDWTHITAGLDWGSLSWCVVMGRNAINQRLYLLNIGIFEDTAEELGAAKAVEAFLAPYQPDLVIADAGYGKDRNSYLLRKLCPLGNEGRFYAQWYNPSQKASRTFQPEWSEPQRARVLVDRTMQLKNICHAIKEREFGLLNLSLDKMQLMRRHFRALAPLKEIDDDTKEIVETISSSGDDHLVHAAGSSLLAQEKLSRVSRFDFSFE